MEPIHRQSPETQQAAVRAVESYDAQVYISGGTERIEFTGEKFTQWYEAERQRWRDAVLAVAAERLRAEAADLRRTFNSRRWRERTVALEYAANALTEGIDGEANGG